MAGRRTGVRRARTRRRLAEAGPSRAKTAFLHEGASHDQTSAGEHRSAPGLLDPGKERSALRQPGRDPVEGEEARRKDSERFR